MKKIYKKTDANGHNVCYIVEQTPTNFFEYKNKMDYSPIKVAELKEIAKTMGLKPTGNKAEIIERIQHEIRRSTAVKARNEARIRADAATAAAVATEIAAVPEKINRPIKRPTIRLRPPSNTTTTATTAESTAAGDMLLKQLLARLA
jgi:hypothetical protein